MKTIDEMLNLDLLTPDQHLQISAWIARSSSPEEILQMPAPLWQPRMEARGVILSHRRPGGQSRPQDQLTAKVN